MLPAKSSVLRRVIPRVFLTVRVYLYLLPKSKLMANSSLSPAAPLTAMFLVED